MKKIVLHGNPLSTNHIYKSRCAGGFASVYMSKAGKDRKEEYQWEVKSQWKDAPIEGDVMLDVILYFGDLRKHDIDNYNKLAIDSLSKIVFTDDSQIVDLHLIKEYDKSDPRIEIVIN